MTGAGDHVRISACIIAKDEADRIGPCLESVAFCDEIVVLDSGSTDGTPDLCRDAGARVIETDWPGWVAQKNRAVEAATHDWILSLDADERVDPPLRAAIEALRDGALGQADSPRAYDMTRRVFYLGRWIQHGGWYPEWRTRLFHRAHARWGGIDPHDRVETDARVARIRQGNLEHFTYRSIDDHLRQMNRFTAVGAQQLFDRGKRVALPSVIFKPPWRFLHMYVLRGGFLDGKAGLIVAVLHAYAGFLKYAKLWDLVRRDKQARREG
ncbi:MAG: glycosyltransferase family 2 protein [Planctomycetota bacterium]|nr:glycosyltransferase family 2 protein [Planctomycetota bacterium]